MQEPDVSSSLAPRPAAVFRAALTSVAAKERAVRARRPDRVQAVASLSDSDLVALSQEFELLLRASGDVTALATRLQTALRSLSPDGSSGEADRA
jgi:hypothetical protein